MFDGFNETRNRVVRDLRGAAADELDTRRQMGLLAAARAAENPLGRAAFWASRHLPNAAVRGAQEVAEYVLQPATTVGPLVSKGVSMAFRNPDVTVPLLTAAALTPALVSLAKDDYHTNLEEVNRMYQNPGSVRLAHEVTLESFMSKTAVVRGESLGQTIGSGLGKGLGEQFGKGLIDRLFTSAGSALDKILSTPARKDLIKRLFDSDPILSDALRRNPQMQKQLLEAYATMIKFAPSLTTDINAVRSFLREVVLGGGNVNYAVIKNLIDTEKAYHR